MKLYCYEAPSVVWFLNGFSTDTIIVNFWIFIRILWSILVLCSILLSLSVSKILIKKSLRGRKNKTKKVYPGPRPNLVARCRTTTFLQNANNPASAPDRCRKHGDSPSLIRCANTFLINNLPEKLSDCPLYWYTRATIEPEKTRVSVPLTVVLALFQLSRPP